MNTFLELARRLTELGARYRERMRYLKARALLYGLAAGAGISTLGFSTAALYLYLAQANEPWQAAAFTALIMGVAATALAVAALALRRDRVKPASALAETSRTAGHVLDEALRASSLRTTDLVIASLVAGVAVGAGTRRRRNPD